jgi:hypothetical protein
MFDEREEGEYVREDLRGKGIRVFGIFFWLGFSFLFCIVFLSRLFFWLGDFVGLFFFLCCLPFSPFVVGYEEATAFGSSLDSSTEIDIDNRVCLFYKRHEDCFSPAFFSFLSGSTMARKRHFRFR